MPSFFIVGPPRTGTSWLHEVLRGRVSLPVYGKETRFFDLHFHRGTPWYLSRFGNSHHSSSAGEVAPTYFASSQARLRIRDLIPAAKIVCIFRNPVERLLSLYRLKRAYGWISWSLTDALLLDPELTESSRYATYLKEWQRAFGADQVLPTLFEDLRDHTQGYIDRLADFIGIPRFALTANDQKRIHASEFMTMPRSYVRTRTARLLVEWLEARRFGGLVDAARNSPVRKLFLGGGPAFSDASCELSETVLDLFRREVDALEAMLGRDLSAWKPRSKLCEPVLA